MLYIYLIFVCVCVCLYYVYIYIYFFLSYFFFYLSSSCFSKIFYISLFFHVCACFLCMCKHMYFPSHNFPLFILCYFVIVTLKCIPFCIALMFVWFSVCIFPIFFQILFFCWSFQMCIGHLICFLQYFLLLLSGFFSCVWGVGGVFFLPLKYIPNFAIFSIYFFFCLWFSSERASVPNIFICATLMSK